MNYKFVTHFLVKLAGFLILLQLLPSLVSWVAAYSIGFIRDGVVGSDQALMIGVSYAAQAAIGAFLLFFSGAVIAKITSPEAENETGDLGIAGFEKIAVALLGIYLAVQSTSGLVGSLFGIYADYSNHMKAFGESTKGLVNKDTLEALAYNAFMMLLSLALIVKRSYVSKLLRNFDARQEA